MDTGRFVSIASGLTARVRRHTSKISRNFAREWNYNLPSGEGLETQEGLQHIVTWPVELEMFWESCYHFYSIVLAYFSVFPCWMSSPTCAHHTMLLSPFLHKPRRSLLRCARWGREWLPGSCDIVLLVVLPPNLQLDKSTWVRKEKLVCILGEVNIDYFFFPSSC